MTDIEKINRKFLVTLISFIIVVLILAGIMITTNILVPDQYEDYEYIVYFTVFIIMLFILPYFKNRIDKLTNISYILKIRSHEAPPLELNRTINPNFGGYLRSLDFVKFTVDKDHIFYYRMEKDTVKRIFKRYMLEVIVLIDEKQEDFFLDTVDTNIGKIQQQMLTEGKKINRMLITQIKEISNLDDQTKEKIKEIAFFRTNLGVISTINVGIYKKANMGVLLYSDTYSPSLYYQKHIDLIKQII